MLVFSFFFFNFLYADSVSLHQNCTCDNYSRADARYYPNGGSGEQPTDTHFLYAGIHSAHVCTYTLQLSGFSTLVKSRGNSLYDSPVVGARARDGIHFNIWYNGILISLSLARAEKVCSRRDFSPVGSINVAKTRPRGVPRAHAKNASTPFVGR